MSEDILLQTCRRWKVLNLEQDRRHEEMKRVQLLKFFAEEMLASKEAREALEGFVLHCLIHYGPEAIDDFLDMKGVESFK